MCKERQTRVFIDEALKGYIVPTEVRNTSFNEDTTFTSGSRIPVDTTNAKYIRLFCAWTGIDNKGCFIDVDLSAGIVRDGEFDRISYYSQSGDFAVHSGDYTSCNNFDSKEGTITAEYIDIDIKKAKDYFKNAKEGYVIIATNIFDGASNFSDMNAWIGAQLVNNRTTKKNTINLNNTLFKSKMASKVGERFQVSLGYDVKNDELVMIDLYMRAGSGSHIDAISNKMDMFKQKFFNATKYQENMHSFLKLYCKVNDYQIVEKQDDADIVCHFTDVKGLSANQEMFNISNNLENIVGMLQ